MAKNYSKIIIPILMIFAFSFRAAYAQDVEISMNSIGRALRFEYLTIEDGLPDNFVASILQDYQGFLWFGTKSGLSRYDGIDFVTFNYDPKNSNSLSYNFVWSLLQDKVGNLWIGTLGGGFNKFDPVTGKFTRYFHSDDDLNSLSYDFVWSIHEDRNNFLWIATDGGGLDKFDRSTETFVHYKHLATDPNSLSHNSVTSITASRQCIADIGEY